ncbi:hypothetical protein [Rosistilla oblonga]|uniref:hypothetical protein n=1 Tax=Rosistilla oblonga TaxID=2527990 RepID=UPI003A973EB3
MNLDGYQLHLAAWDKTRGEWQGPGDFFGEPPTRNWVHGWPLAFGARLSIRRPMPTVQTLDQIPLTSRWPFDTTAIVHFNPWLFAADLIIALVVTFLAFLGVNSICRRYDLRIQFRISSLLVATSAIAIGIPFHQQIFATRYPLQYAAGVVIVTASAIAVCVSLVLSLNLYRFVVRKAEP